MGKSRGGKVIKRKVASSSDADVKDLNKMFSQITGSSDPEREILLPKINKIYTNIIEYNKLFNVLLNFKVFTDQFSEYHFWFDDIKAFLANLISTTSTDITKKYDGLMHHSYHDLKDSELFVFYKNLKENIYLKKMVITGSNLSVYKTHIADINKLDDAFINREPGLILQPLVFCTLDLKIIWNFANISEMAKKFILSIMRHTYLIGIDTYDIFTSPDVDIKKFSKILIDSISKMKKMIPRCDKAFAVIEKSVELLETNFKNYFRGSVEAGNPSIIIESFIIDISTSQKASPLVTSEFKKIVAFLRERSAQNNDPKIKKLFSMLNTQFSSVETELGVKTEPIPEDKTPQVSGESIIEPLFVPCDLQDSLSALSLTDLKSESDSNDTSDSEIVIVK